MAEPVIRNISDTARWAATFRARETEQLNPLFRDPFARKLAGERGEQIAEKVKFGTQHTWSWITRTYLFDHLIEAEIERGTDMVINLAAGLDARPYRMNLRPDLKWIEVDLPEITAYKEEILAGDRPRCDLRRVKIDLADRDARRALFEDLGRQASRALIVSEGLLVYLTDAQAADLARDLADQKSFTRWICELVSPGLLRLMRKKMGRALEEANAPLQFAPAEGPRFFEQYGWRVAEVHSMLHTAAKLKRLPLFMRPFALFRPPKDGVAGKQPWSGVAVLERA